jgi:hypothetical protein
VHALVAAVVLRAPHARSVDLDAERDQPRAQLRQPAAGSHADPRRAVVDPDRAGHSVSSEQPHQMPAHDRAAGRRHQRCREYELAERIAHRQRLAALPTPRQPPTLEVDGPQVVARVHFDVRLPLDRPDPHGRAPRLQVPVAPQHARHRADTRGGWTVLALEHADDRLGTPLRPACAEREHLLHEPCARAPGGRHRPPALLRQPVVAHRLEPPQPLVPGLPRDPERPTRRARPNHLLHGRPSRTRASTP